MSSYNPTIVAASLSDEELQKSIDSLVNKVKEGTDKMKKYMTDAVTEMKKQLQSLGNVNITTGNTSDGGSSRRTKEQKDEKKAVEETTVSYSQLEATQQRLAKESLRMSYARAVKIQTDDVDLMYAKYERLVALLNSNRTFKFMSPAQIASAEQEVKRLEAAIKNVSITSKNADQESVSSTKARVAAEHRYAQQLIQDEERRRKSIIETGEAADVTARKIMNKMYKQLGEEGNLPIKGVKELQDAFRVMYRTYFELTEAERNSQFGIAMWQNMAKVLKALKEVDKYNKELTGFKRVDDKTDYTIQSYTRLRFALKSLTDQYNNMSVAQIRAGEANNIIQNIQRINRETQKLQERLSRPISFEAAMGLSQNTLSDMAYKIRQLQSYKQGIDITKEGAAQKIRDVDTAVANLKKEMDKYMNTGKDVLQMNNALGRSWNYMKNRLAFYFTVGASTQFVKNLIEVRSQYEMNERALGILINSAERGTQIFQELSNMALVSPYTLIELSSAAKQLTAYDIAARDVVDTTRRLADMASAVGIPIERLTYALGQIKAYGYLNSRDNRMFANAGIPLVKQLSDYYTELEGKMVSTADVYDRIKKKAVDYNTVMQVINKMTDEGGKFFDFQAKMADTLKVRLANLTLAWNNMLNDIGKDTQGILTWGIGALRELFTHWKALDSAMKQAAGIGALIVATRSLGFLLNRLLVTMGANVTKMAAAEVAGIRFANVIKTIWGSLRAIATSPVTWISLAVFAFVDLYKAIWGANEAQQALNKSIRDGAKDNYENISKYLEQYNELRRSLYKTERTDNGRGSIRVVGQDIDKNEANKAWEVMREQIELTTKNADLYIGRLMTINNVSERLREGFNLIENIGAVNAAIKELDDDTIKIDRDLTVLFVNITDGLITNLKDLKDAEKEIIDTFGSIDAAKNRNSKLYYDYENRELKQLRKDLDETTESILNFINLKRWSGDTTKIEETFSQIFNKIALENNLSPSELLRLRLEAANAEYKALKNALQMHINDENNALAKARDENIKADIEARLKVYKDDLAFMQSNTAQSRVYWEDFVKWMSQQHKSEVQAMFQGQSAEQIKMLDFSRDKYNKWVVELAQKYAKEHGMSYKQVFDQLKNYILNANQWSIRIPLIISSEGEKSVYDTLTDADKAADTAYQKIQRLQTRINELANKGAKQIPLYTDGSDDDKEYTRALQELTDAQKDYNMAIAAGGKSKKENAAARKAQKAAESELQKTLKEELQLIDQVRSSYDKLTKAGVGHFEAIEASTQGFDRSVKNINKVLNKYGIALDLSKFAGTTNPHELVEMFQKQIDVLMKSPNAKPAEIQDLEVKVQKLGLDVKEFDHKKFTDSLNNELGRLKDEYELAVSLDADPEMGNMFAEMMGININDLPRTVKEYADLYTKYLNEYLSKTDAGFQLDNLNLTNDSLRALEERVKEGTLTQAAYEAIAKAVQDVRDKRKKDFEETTKEFNALIKKYGEYQAKMEEVRQTADKERLTFVKTYGGEEEIKQAIQITTEIGAEKDPTKKEQLRQQLITLVNQLAGDDATRLKLKVAIDTQQARGEAGVDFEEFQKSPEWVVATGDLAGMTNKAIGGLIDSLESYKKKAKNLDSKQIKNVNNALKALYKQQRSNNPFNIIGNAIMEAKERAAEFEPKLKDLDTEIKAIEKDIESGKATEAQKAKLKSLKAEYQDLINKQEQAGTVSASTVVEGINNAISAAQTAVSMFNQMAEALGGKGMTDASKTISRVANTLQMAGSGAAAGAQIGGGYGAIIGAVVGGLAGVITNWADVWSGNADITEKVEQSVHWARILQRTYKDLEYQIEKTAGTGKIQYQELIVLNKRLQLAELQRQLALEESRKSKNRDQDRIDDLKSQIEDMEREIQDAVDNIVNDLLGISGVGDAAESMMDTFVEALRNGEDAMKAFDESIDDMIANMIKKMFVTKILQPWLDNIWNTIQADIDKRGEDTKTRIAGYNDILRQIEDGTVTGLYNDITGEWIRDKDSMVNYINGKINTLNKQLAEETTPTLEDIKKYAEMLRDGRITIEQWYDYINGVITDFGLINDSATDKSLSALQQGIQGITETTAGALEAYMNGVSQQVYLQSTLMMQINETIQSFDIDVQTSTLGDILLQLQNSYQVQQSIQTILNGWSTPSGLAVRVEMN